MENYVATVKQFCRLLGVVALLLVAVTTAWASEEQINGAAISFKVGTSSSTLVQVASMAATVGLTVSITTLAVYAVTPTATVAWDLGQGRTGNGYAYLDLHGDATYSDYGFRALRGTSGPNDSSIFYARGTDSVYLYTVDIAPIELGTNNVTRMYISSAGPVAIGSKAPSAWLDVSGTVYSRTFNAGAATSFDWSQGNVQYTSANCGAFTFTNMQNGGQYTLAVQGQGGGTCSFTHTGLTVDMAPNQTATAANTDTVYNFQRIGSVLYVLPQKFYSSGASCNFKSYKRVITPSHGYSMAGTPDLSIIYRAGSSTMSTSTDGGVTWVSQSAPGGIAGATGIATSADGQKVVTGAFFNPAGKIYTSTNGGSTWTARGTVNQSWAKFASSADGVKLVGVGNGNKAGSIYTSADSGVTWTARTAAGSRNWDSVTMSSDGTKLAAGVWSGFVYTSTDSGATWTQRGTSRAWYDLSSSSDGSVLVGATDSGVQYSTNSGVTWTAVGIASGEYDGAAVSGNGQVLLAAGPGDFFVISLNGGTTWNKVGSVDRNWYAPAVSDDGKKIMVGMFDQIELNNGNSPIANMPVYTFTCP